MSMEQVKALAFDVFGTVVDTRGSVIKEGETYWKARGVNLDWGQFFDEWQKLGAAARARVVKGEIPWATFDELRRRSLDELLPQFGLGELSEADRERLNQSWNRLTPWPDSVPGLTRLKRKYILVTLSNGSFAGQVSIAKNAGLPWDCVLAPDVLGHKFKPAPEMYLGAARLLNLSPGQVALVAAHKYDLQAARGNGLHTAFIRRPNELGLGRPPLAELNPEPWMDVFADGLEDLADKLGV